MCGHTDAHSHQREQVGRLLWKGVRALEREGLMINVRWEVLVKRRNSSVTSITTLAWLTQEKSELGSDPQSHVTLGIQGIDWNSRDRLLINIRTISSQLFYMSFFGMLPTGTHIN